MISQQFIVPQLDDLMKWHIYIGCCQKDQRSVQSLHELVRTLGLTCSLRSSLDADEVSVEQNIEEGINFSQRCILYVSPAYINDDWTTCELQEAERKVKYFGKKAVIALIEPSVDQCHLHRFSQFTKITLDTDRPICTESLSTEFLSEFELKPILSSIPKSNIGVGVAITYFYGFLQLQLPGLMKNFEEVVSGQDSIDWNRAVKKMLIIIPESVDSPPKLTEPGSLEQTNLTVKQFACRSGREKREYSVPIYKLTPGNGQESYHYVSDIPACLYALHEAHERESTGLSKSELYQARNEFCFTLKGLLNHPDNLASCAYQWEMLVWPDTEENPNRKKLSEFLYEQIQAKQLTEVVQMQIEGPVQATSESQTYILQKGVQCSTVYRDVETYPLKPDHRGCCVIINNSTFSSSNLEERTGAAVESNSLKDLFTQLHFDVDLQKNLSATEMMNCLESYQHRDHSMNDAFVCCVMSHGKHGSVFAADGNPVRILQLMELFYDEQCPSLTGKPKLFFIGACQTEASGSSELQETEGVRLIANAAPDHVTDPDHVTAPDHVTQPPHDLIPSSNDFFVSYATLPKRVAYAHPGFGGIYVKALCKNLKKDDEIEMALRKVCSDVEVLLSDYSKKIGEDYTSQKPIHMFVTKKSLFLHAGT